MNTKTNTAAAADSEASAELDRKVRALQDALMRRLPTLTPDEVRAHAQEAERQAEALAAPYYPDAPSDDEINAIVACIPNGEVHAERAEPGSPEYKLLTWMHAHPLHGLTEALTRQKP